jgi:hypothetical protein
VEVSDSVESTTTSSAPSKISQGETTATPTDGSPEASTAAETTDASTSKVTALPDTEASSEKPSLGLTGPERPSSTTTQEEPEPEETDNAAVSRFVDGKMCMGVIFATIMALMA